MNQYLQKLHQVGEHLLFQVRDQVEVSEGDLVMSGVWLKSCLKSCHCPVRVAQRWRRGLVDVWFDVHWRESGGVMECLAAAAAAACDVLNGVHQMSRFQGIEHSQSPTKAREVFQQYSSIVNWMRWIAVRQIMKEMEFC